QQGLSAAHPSNTTRLTCHHPLAEGGRCRSSSCSGACALGKAYLAKLDAQSRASRASATASSIVSALPCSHASAKALSSSRAGIAETVCSFILATQASLTPICSRRASKQERSRAAVSAFPGSTAKVPALRQKLCAIP